MDFVARSLTRHVAVVSAISLPPALNSWKPRRKVTNVINEYVTRANQSIGSRGYLANSRYHFSPFYSPPSQVSSGRFIASLGQHYEFYDALPTWRFIPFVLASLARECSSLWVYCAIDLFRNITILSFSFSEKRTFQIRTFIRIVLVHLKDKIDFTIGRHIK